MNKSSLLFAVVCLIGIAGNVFAQITPPVPTDLVAEQLPNTVATVKLTWQAPSGTWQYRIYRSVGDTMHFAARGMAFDRVFYDSQVLMNTTYFYRVTSLIHHNGTTIESAPSNIASITIIPPPPPVQGTITGTVTDDSTASPIFHVRIRFFRVTVNSTTTGPYVFTDSTGQYTALLDTGTYIVKAEPPFPYRPEWFDNAPDPSTATRILVTENSTFTANFGLGRYAPPPPPVHGTIAGTVLDDSTGLPIHHVRIRFFRLSSHMNFMPYTYTDSAGQYSAQLDTGRYLVKAEPPFPYTPEWYDNSPYPSGATPVQVNENQTSVANFALSRPEPPTYAYINGTVTDTANVPIPFASVAIIRTIQEMNALAALTGNIPGMGNEAVDLEAVGHTRGVVWRGRTDSLGNYQARVVSERSYIAMASKFGYLPEYFDNKTNPAEADIIHVTGDTSGIDFSLSVNPLLNNSISGVVRDSGNMGVPSRVILLPLLNTPSPHMARFGHTDSNGVYLLTGVRAGKYFVLAMPFSGFSPSFYKENECGIATWQLADTVEIVGDVTGIDICVTPITSNGIARVSGTIRSSSGSVLEGVNVLAMTISGSVAGYGLTDHTGRYSIEAVQAGDLTMLVDKPGYRNVEGGISIAPLAFTVTGVDFTLQPMTPTSVNPAGTVPETFRLDQNYPNPFNPTTTISFTLPVDSRVSVTVYNLLGQEVAGIINTELPAGKHAVVWNGQDNSGRIVSTGLYFYRMKAVPFSGGTGYDGMKKMILLK